MIRVPKLTRKAVFLSTIIVAAAVFILYSIFIKQGSRSVDLPTAITTADGEKVDLEPATPNEKAEADANKDNIVKRNEQIKNPSPPSQATNSINIVITEANKSSVRAYVTGIFEEGGTCTATATQGTETKRATSKAFENVSYTQCGPMNWSLGAGSWTVSVSYKSSAAEGKSPERLVQ